MQENNIIFYGERGFVNALVLDMHKDFGLIKKFLSSIHFCSNNMPEWISRVEDAKFFIEPSFAEFGDPDLLILCQCGKEKHLIFLEAKVEPYEDSAIDIKDLKECIEDYKKANDGRKNLKTIGINSRINTQLTLKFRLSRLLKERETGSQIREGKLWDVYYNENLDSINHPRQLKKGLNIKFCDENLKGINDFWFVALTSDTLPIVPFKNKNTRPFIFDESGTEVWDKLKDHFGIITYDDLDAILTQGFNYNQAKKYFEISNAVLKLNDTSTFSIKPENWRNFKPDIREKLCEEMIQNIKQAIHELSIEEDNNKYEYYDIERNSGSLSFKIGNQTVISVFPYRKGTNEGLMLALRLEHFNNSYKSDFKIGPFLFGAVNKRQFMGYFIEQKISMDDEGNIYSIIKEYWKNCFK